MIEGNRVEVFLSDELKTKTSLFSLKKELAICGTHDNGFRLINSENNLQITFEDISNFSIDYANNGHLAFVISTPWLLISIPEIVSNDHLKILNNIMDNLDGNTLAIYAFINGQLNSFVYDNTYKNNKDMLVKVLKKKKLILNCTPYNGQ